jgi:hypothetical protein
MERMKGRGYPFQQKGLARFLLIPFVWEGKVGWVQISVRVEVVRLIAPIENIVACDLTY